MMKKLLVTLAVIAGIAIFCVPYVTGKVAESETRRFIDQINQSRSEYGATEIVAYKRGFRTTEASYRYTLPTVSSGLNEVGSIEYNCQSRHGITEISFSCKLTGDNDYSKFVDENLDGKDPLSMTGSVSIFGKIDQRFAIDAIQGLSLDSGVFDITKTELRISTDNELSHYQMSGNSGGVTISRGAEQMTLGRVKVEGDLNESKEGLLLGDVQLNIAGLTTKEGNETFEINGLDIATSAAKNGINTDSTLSMSVDNVSAKSSPFTSIQNVDLTLIMNGINTAALVEYQEFAKRLQQDMLASLESDEQPNAGIARSMEVVPIIEKILSSEVLLEAVLSVRLDQQPASASIKIELLEAINFDELQMLLTVPQQVLPKLDIKLRSNVAKELVESQAILENAIAQSPLFRSSAEEYSSELMLGKKNALNGNDISLDELQMLFAPRQ